MTQADRLRNLERRILDEFTTDELEELEPALREISDAIMKLETGDLFFVIGPGRKLFRCEKVDAAQ